MRLQFGLALISLCSAANAALITIDADNYAAGTVIAPTPDVAISYLYHGEHDPYFTYRAAIAVIEPTCDRYSVCAAVTGTQVLGDGTLVDGELVPRETLGLSRTYGEWHPDGFGPGNLEPDTIARMRAFNAIRVDFSSPTDYVSADFFGVIDPAAIFAFGHDGTVLSLALSTGNINRVDFGPDCTPAGFEGACYQWQHTVTVQHDVADIAFVIMGSTDSRLVPDAIRFEVPEAATLPLFGFGLLAMMRMSRRSRLRK